MIQRGSGFVGVVASEGD